MAEPIVSFLLETIGKLLIEEAKFLTGVSDEAEQLHSELKMMRALLKDADEKLHEAAIVKEWVSQSKDLAYEAENVLETHAFKLASRQRARGTRNVIRRYACILNECYIRHKVGLEIRSLNARVSNLTRRFQEYGIRAVTERERSSSRQQQLRMAYSYVADDEDFVGFGRDIETLVQVLVNEDESFGHYGVVSICGMGGSGKTTLARKVYNHPNVKHHFDSVAWFCVSQQWQTRDILQGILVCFLPERRGEIKEWRDDEMVEQLLRFQQNRKCLVVLDDIWSIDAWECIKVAFPIRKKGNKILLTTRNRGVAIHVGPNGYSHQQRLLTDAESWELLQRKALIRDRLSQEYGDIQNLEVLGKEMVKFCGGLPLAVVVLGGILATKHTSIEWNAVYRNIKSYLGKGESIEQQEGEVQKILALSYNDLPYKLKPCFLYLSGFLEDSEIKTERLYHLWIAEGMVFAEDRRGEESMLDVAERYLGELVKRCIVHVKVATRYPLIRKFTSCSLHDLMRDLCLAKASEENFLKVIDYQHGNDNELANPTFPSCGNMHRLMIYLGVKDTQKYAPPGIEVTKHLRTLVFYATPHGDLMAQLAESQLNRFKMLRSLTIEGVITPALENIEDNNSIPDNIFELPIGNLIHLRYLNLTGSKLVISPTSISNLEHLETLDLSTDYITRTQWAKHAAIPLLNTKIIWTRNVPLRMRGLKYLYLDRHCSLQIYFSSHLEILEGFDPTKHDVRDFSVLTNLQKLGVLLAEGKHVEEIINYISNSQKLRQANIWIHPDTFFSPEMELALPRRLFCSNLQHLTYDGKLGKLPDYNSQIFANLLELRLAQSMLEEDPIETLEKLPNLQSLWLYLHAFVGKEIVCHSNGFPQLRFLLLHHLHYLEKWTVEKGSLPNLSCLEICSCECLTMIPEGLRYIKPIKELVIEAMPENFLNRILVVDGRKGEDFDKICHIPSIMLDGSPLVLPL